MTRIEIKRELAERFSMTPSSSYQDDPKNLKVINLKGKTVLFIGDIHAPFVKRGYLSFTKKMYKKYKCDTVIFAGDILDNHYSSFHTTDPNGHSGGTELDYALKEIAKWYKTYPEAYVLIGNHDRLIMRQAQASNIPRQWIRDYKDVLDTPNWIFLESMEVDDVLYIHGEGGTATTQVKNNFQSTAQGHLHSEAYIRFFVGNKKKVFALQTGWGGDRRSFAMAYGKHYKKQIVACSVIDKGTPYLELMNLK